jgi:hypothetical protein
MEAIDLGFVMVDFRGKNHSLLVVFEEMVGETSPVVGSVNINRSKFRNVNFFASGTVYFET